MARRDTDAAARAPGADPLEGCKMNPTKSNGQGVTSTLTAETTYQTNDLNYATAERRRKGQATATALLAPEQLSFLPPPPFCPTWPTKGTLADKALGLLLDGHQFDHPTFERLTGSWCARQPIAELRKLGWPVVTIEVPSPTELVPNRVIGLYRLDSKYIGLALAAKDGSKTNA